MSNSKKIEKKVPSLLNDLFGVVIVSNVVEGLVPSKSTKKVEHVKSPQAPKVKNLPINNHPRGSHRGFNRGDGGRSVNPWKR